MTKVYLIRHAEAEGNLYRRIHGHYDSLVTQRGEKQIEALAQRFKNVRIDALYSSDLIRARMTAAAITKHHDVEMHSTQLLREVNMGVWEDRTWGDIELEDTEQLMKFTSNPAKWRVGGSENLSDLSERMKRAVRDFAAAHDEMTIAMVSHGMAIRTLLCGAMGIPTFEIDRVQHGDNTSVALLEVEGNSIDVVYFNDNSHLSEEISTFAKQSWWKGSSGADKNNLRFEPLNLKKENDFYLKCYSDAWMASHGTLQGFMPEVYLTGAEAHVKGNDQALMKVMQRDLPAGLIELDTRREAETGAGRISLCYMLPEYRGKGLSVQMIGHAVSVYRGLGRKALRLAVAEENFRAINFYKHYGFKQTGEDRGVRGRQLLLEMEI